MPSATNPVSHTPAWKRLGLELKSPGCEPEPRLLSADRKPEAVPSQKRKRPDLKGESATHKSQKTSHHTSGRVHQHSQTPTLSNKKSVTFTPETKSEDGDSIKHLLGSCVTDHKSRDSAIDVISSGLGHQTRISGQVDEQANVPLNEKEKRTKRTTQAASKPARLRAKGKKSPKIVASATTRSRPFLQYLKQYHECRDNWKFNKNHQSHLLRHIFDVSAIPSDYAHLILPYVRGLQGAVRTRLRDEAIAVKVKDIEDGVAAFPEEMVDKGRKQLEYEAKMKDYIATKIENDPDLSLPESGYEEAIMMGLSDVAMKARVAKRLRAEGILDELSSATDSVSHPNSSEADSSEGIAGSGKIMKRLRMNDGSIQKMARKRKQRTATVDETSESSDEEEGDADLEKSPDTTSSSSSSSSSGDSQDSSLSQRGTSHISISSSDSSASSEEDSTDESSSEREGQRSEEEDDSDSASG